VRRATREFAKRLGFGIATVVRYELSRAPKGKALAKLAQVAAESGFERYAAIFRQAALNARRTPAS
jgi:hypothetical protein